VIGRGENWVILDSPSEFALEIRSLRRKSSACVGSPKLATVRLRLRRPAEACDGPSELVPEIRSLRRRFSACVGASQLATIRLGLRRPAAACDEPPPLAPACRSWRQSVSRCARPTLAPTVRLARARLSRTETRRRGGSRDDALGDGRPVAVGTWLRQDRSPKYWTFRGSEHIL
jgi:hypothetical protein